MLPSELVSKPIHEWSVDDLNLIVARQSEESQFLEFKERMPLKNQSVGWNFNGILHANERDGLAKRSWRLRMPMADIWSSGLKKPKRSRAVRNDLVT